MLKRFLAFVLTFSFLILSQIAMVQAKEKLESKDNKIITANTIITEENLNDILQYFGIDQNDFFRTNVTGGNVNTVGELLNAIEEVEKLTFKVKNNSKNYDYLKSIKSSSNQDINMLIADSGIVMLYSSVNVGSSYTLEYEVSAEYSSGQWTGVYSADVSIDSDFIFYTYKIGYKSLIPSYTPTTVKLQSSVRVDIYVGIGNFGIVKIGSQTITGTDYWGTSYIPR
jgi:hypothetical protein